MCVWLVTAVYVQCWMWCSCESLDSRCSCRWMVCHAVGLLVRLLRLKLFVRGVLAFFLKCQ
jgi:hypothetical protein